jgi:ribosome-associated translation inhibitor RaiA
MIDQMHETPIIEPVELPVENDREFKAHIYQQLAEIQPYLSADSQVAVMVQQDKAEDQTRSDYNYTLTLIMTFGEYKVESEGKASNVYEAFGLAKRKMMDVIDDWYSSVDTSERDAQVQSVIEGTHTLH